VPPAAGHFGLAELVGLRPQPDSPIAVVDAFCARYTSPKTREDQARRLKELLRGCPPTQLRDADVLDWARGCGKDLANNSVRNRLALARTFLRWCDRRGIGPQLDLEEEFAVLRRSYPATYGKVQDRHPARYLDQQQVRALVAACADGTWQGIRDEIAIRFGLLGTRVAEICRLTWSNLMPDGTLAWIGKGRRPRTARLGPVFAELLARWERAYECGLGRPVGPDDPIVCRMVTANQHSSARRAAWGSPILPDTFRRLLLHRSGIAGLGHVAPHDLRRTTAKLLKDAVTPEGGHLFDIDDIRVVLGHARIDTTQRYLNPRELHQTREKVLVACRYKARSAPGRWAVDTA